MTPVECDDTLILEAEPRRAASTTFRFVERDDPQMIASAYRELARKIELSRIAKRFSHGLRFFQFHDGDRLVGTSWFVSGGSRFLDECGLEVAVDERTIWVRDAFVNPAF